MLPGDAREPQVRAVLLNSLYRGRARWNLRRYHDEGGNPTLSVNPESEHGVHHDERVRIVSGDLWARVEARFTTEAARAFGKKGVGKVDEFDASVLRLLDNEVLTPAFIERVVALASGHAG